MKKGFTLAEVLITLGIIGVVAAMTLPSIINKTEKIILKNQFKKAYSVYSQALLKTAVEYDGMPPCYYQLDKNELVDSAQTASCLEFYDNFAKNLKVIKTCKGNALAGGCIPKYKFQAILNGCGGYSESNMNNISTAFVFADGSHLFEYVAQSGGSHALFAFDVNGMRGPNKPGEDLFSVDIQRTFKGQYRLSKAITSCLPAPPGSLKYEDMFK